MGIKNTKNNITTIINKSQNSLRLLDGSKSGI